VAYLFYARLIGLTAGTLVYLFFIALILGHRRPRLFERILFFLVLSLFLIYAGGLLQMNAEIEYGAAPLAAHLFSEGLAALGFLSLPALVWHAHYAYRRQIRRSQPSAFAKPLLVLLYLAAFAEVVFGISPSWVGSLGGGARLSAVLDNFLLVAGTSLYFVAFMDTVFEFQDWRAAKNKKERELFLALFGVSLVLTILLGLSGGTRLSGSSRGEALGAAIVWIALLPGALLIYFALKHNFLEYGAQRDLVYALSATFLALLYLAFVRRVSGWLEPALPPEATASILLFVLIFLFEPLERVIGPVLHRRFQERVGRLQQLSTEFQTEAQRRCCGAGRVCRAEDSRGIWAGRGANLGAARSGAGAARISRRPRSCGAVGVDEEWKRDWIAGGGDDGVVSDGGDFGGAGISCRAAAGEH